MRIFLLPIEPIELRYSAQWHRWFSAKLAAHGEVVVVNGQRLRDGIVEGQFLDVVDTHHYKSTQLAAFMRLYHEGAVEAGDAVLLLDGWSPSVTALAYVRDLGSVPFRIGALFHAGAYDPWDFLGRNYRVAHWAGHIERGWLTALDYVFVSTYYHARLLREERGSHNVRVVPFPLYPDEWADAAQPWATRPRRVVWPHRIAAEKDPDEWAWIRRAYEIAYPEDPVEWVRTKDHCTTKADYYRMLGSSRVVVSTAHQETWGIAMLEGATLGAYPVAPNRLSYPELFPRSLYSSRDEAVARIREGLDRTAPFVYDASVNEASIGAIARELRGHV